MRTPIETNQKFVFRLEDFVYASLIVYFLIFGTFSHQVITFNSAKNSAIPFIFMICLVGICIIVPALLIFLSYRRRLQYDYFVEDESILCERNGREIFHIPFKKIVSVRVYNKRGTQGSIIFYTDLSSKDYIFSYFPVANIMPLSLYGLTRKKINLVKNRKELLTAIYRVNPKVYFIE
ncbi:MAG: hypothetical protein ACO1N0_19760 [Fluviicola sp.]